MLKVSMFYNDGANMAKDVIKSAGKNKNLPRSYTRNFIQFQLNKNEKLLKRSQEKMENCTAAYFQGQVDVFQNYLAECV